MTAIGPLLGEGKEAEVFAYGEHVLKLYRARAGKASPFREAGILALLQASGVAAPRVHAVGAHGDRWGLVMDRVTGRSLGETLDERTDSAVLMAQLLMGIHGHRVALPSLKIRLQANIERTEHLDDGLRARLLAGLDDMQAGDRLCHGDFHPWNILGDAEPVVVDWLDASAGDPAADACRSFVLMHKVAPQLATDFVDTYSRLSGQPVAAIMAWLPFVAGARLAEGVSEDVPALIAMAEQV